MTDYSLTKSRTIQWMIIILVLVALAGAYRYFSVRAATKINSSQNATNTNGLVGEWSFNGADVTYSTTYTTWNPADKNSQITLSNGDLTYATSSAFINSLRVNQGKSGGKWYFEYTTSAGGNYADIGIDDGSSSLVNYIGSSSNAIGYWSTGSVYKNGGIIATYASYTDGDVIGVAFDAGTGEVTFYKNNVLQGSPGTISGTVFVASGNRFTAGVTATANFGATAFTYTPPAGYNAGLYTSTLSGATDTSGSGNNGTLVNGPTTTIGKIGQALSFDGTSYVALPNASLLSLSSATSEKTISVWIKTTANDAAIVTGRGTIGGGYPVFDLSLGENGMGSVAGTPTILVRDDTGNGLTGIRGATAINDGKWHHVVAMRNSSKNLYIYVDGVQVASGTDTMSAGLTVTAADSRIGDESLNGSILNMVGSIDEVRIYNRALSAGEVTSLYNMGVGAKVNASQNASNTSGLIGQWSFNGNNTSWSSSTAGTATDTSGNSNTGTLSSMSQITSPVPGKVGQALFFDGTDDEMTTATDQGNGSNVKIFTLSAWFKTSSASGKKIIGLENGQTGTASISYDRQIHIGTDGKVHFYIWDGAAKHASSSATFTDNNWHHAVAVSTGDSGSITLYVDGVLQQTTAIASMFVAYATSYWRIGGYKAASTYLGVNGYFPGSIDDVRIYNRALSAGEVTSLYNMGIGTKLTP